MRAISPNRQTGVATHVFSRSRELAVSRCPRKSTRGSASPLEFGQDLVNVFCRRTYSAAERSRRGRAGCTLIWTVRSESTAAAGRSYSRSFFSARPLGVAEVDWDPRLAAEEFVHRELGTPVPCQ